MSIMKSLQPITLDELVGKLGDEDETHYTTALLYPRAFCGESFPEREPLAGPITGPVCGECARVHWRHLRGLR